MNVRLSLPPEIEMIGMGSYLQGENTPTMWIALYRDGIEAGECTDGSVTGECLFGRLRARQFFPGSGCGLSIDNVKGITFAESGLRAFEGKLTTEIAVEEGAMIIVWKERRVPFQELTDQDFQSNAIRVMSGLSMAFA